ncbi:MAG TPA: hypothetical protein VNT75_25455 [Symbiobacteriaceae bacterium]|nr:hypothetical protein [Symbiobacteriaceae bacterium]
MRAATVKRILLTFWAVWLAVIASTNLFSLLKALALIDRGFVFASQNFDLVRSFLDTYRALSGFAVLAFTGVVLWQWCAVYLFLTAHGDRKKQNAAFGAALALFAAFLVAGEFFLRFDFEAIHMRIFIALLVSLLAMHLLPDD